MQDVKLMDRWTIKITRHENTRRENAGEEIAGHKNTDLMG